VRVTRVWTAQRDYSMARDDEGDNDDDDDDDDGVRLTSKNHTLA